MKKVNYYKIFLLYIKMSETAYYKRKREIILNRAKNYNENNKEVLRRPEKNKYRELSEEEKYQKQYGRNRYHNMSEEQKKRLKEYQKSYREGNKRKKF